MHGHGHGGAHGGRAELTLSLLACGLTAAGWVGERLAGASVPVTAAFALACLAGAWFAAQSALAALRTRQVHIDTLMVVAAAGAASLGEWFEGALLLSLFSLGHALEQLAMQRARAAVLGLGELVPETALRLGGGAQPEEVPVTALRVGDRVLVKPSSRVAADGTVVEGTSAVDQGPITGESTPADKVAVLDVAAALARPESVPAESRVFAGTLNGPAALTFVVTRLAGDSTLARVIRMVTEVQGSQSPTQIFTQRVERVFVPLMLALVGALLLGWLVVEEPFERSFQRAMAVLVAGSPCALAIATPSAVLAGVARAARSGLLIKGGAPLEALGSVRSIAFDKTGTLTEGRPRLTDVVPLGGATEEELLTFTEAAERLSDHPLASAVVAGARARLAPGVGPLEVRGTVSVAGHGVRAEVAGREVLVGKPAMFEAGSLPAEVEAAVTALMMAGRTVMVVRAGGQFLGVLGVMDSARDAAPGVVAELHALGIHQTIMLTGDHQRVADAVGSVAGLRVVWGDVLPEQKAVVVEALARSSGRVAMVGDGVNDAPALAAATVGIAMGVRGSHVTLETADMVLMRDDLRVLPFALRLSRAARRTIGQNLWISLGMVGALVPATLFGVADIAGAVVLHEGSTVLVVANALRLLRWEP